LKDSSLQASNTIPRLMKEFRQDWPSEHTNLKPCPPSQLTRFLLTE
jgi:hypothetical protein